MNRFLLFMSMFFVLVSCRRTHLQKSQPIKVEKKSCHIKELDFEYFQAKAKIDYDDGTNQFSSPMTIRIRKDSVIWISVNPALGIEVVRALITQDSIFVINKINSENYSRSISEVKDKFGVAVSFHMLQSILVGNLLNPIEPSDSTFTEGDFCILREKKENMEIQHYVSNSSQKIENIVVTDLNTANNVTIKYADFNPLDTTIFAFSSQILANYRVKAGLMKSNVNISYQKVDIKDRKVSFPFKVKNKYERK